jgi:hypothetical protein
MFLHKKNVATPKTGTFATKIFLTNQLRSLDAKKTSRHSEATITNALGSLIDSLASELLPQSFLKSDYIKLSFKGMNENVELITPHNLNKITGILNKAYIQAKILLDNDQQSIPFAQAKEPWGSVLSGLSFSALALSLDSYIQKDSKPTVSSLMTTLIVGGASFWLGYRIFFSDEHDDLKNVIAVLIVARAYCKHDSLRYHHKVQDKILDGCVKILQKKSLQFANTHGGWQEAILATLSIVEEPVAELPRTRRP